MKRGFQFTGDESDAIGALPTSREQFTQIRK